MQAASLICFFCTSVRHEPPRTATDLFLCETEVGEEDALQGYRCLFRAEEVWMLAKRKQTFANWFTKLQLLRICYLHWNPMSAECNMLQAGWVWLGHCQSLDGRGISALHSQGLLPWIQGSGVSKQIEAGFRRCYYAGSIVHSVS